jgi:hypothetical protein
MTQDFINLPTEVSELASKVSFNKQIEVQNVLGQIFTGTDNWEKQVDAIEVKDVNDRISIELAEVARKNSKQARLNAEKIFDAKRQEVQNLKAEYDIEDKLWLKAKQVMQIKFRAIAEKALSQGFSKPVMTVLAKILLKKRKEYYQQLGLASQTLNLTSWLLWFANIALEAQQNTYFYIDFIIKKSVILREAAGKINPRQEKVLLRLFHAGPDGFVGGLSAKNYMSITGASVATTTRDLNDLVKKNILKRTGELKGTRYFLNL